MTSLSSGKHNIFSLNLRVCAQSLCVRERVDSSAPPWHPPFPLLFQSSLYALMNRPQQNPESFEKPWSLLLNPFSSQQFLLPWTWDCSSLGGGEGVIPFPPPTSRGISLSAIISPGEKERGTLAKVWEQVCVPTELNIRALILHRPWWKTGGWEEWLQKRWSANNKRQPSPTPTPLKATLQAFVNTHLKRRSSTGDHLQSFPQFLFHTTLEEPIMEPPPPPPSP